ncbi:MAG: ATPase, partial [Chitinophagia bacterium]|nr:ATPase [Chitinophagia bacterium]
TKVHAAPQRQELDITREFALPLHLLYRAFTDAHIVAQWMGTTVIKLDNHSHGGYEFVTTDPKGNRHVFTGALHELVPNQRIVRTFEMVNTPFGAQLEFLEFEALSDATSRLNMHVVYRTAAVRDQILQLPFVQGINWAHERLENICTPLITAL